MRLTAEQARAIRDVLGRRFGEDVRIWLFGSRVRDDRRGGDIDLYVEAGVPPPDPPTLQPVIRAEVDLMHALGDRKIDLLVRFEGEPERAIHRIARREGVPI
jgi:predicted nucleotidyltransferase